VTRRLLSHEQYMTRLVGPRPSSSSPAIAPYQPRCGCKVNALEADAKLYACPCGDHCTDAKCIAENARRGSS
jgi:hypothetical protein